MSDATTWQESNDRQLAAALAGLRQRLERFIQRADAKSPVPSLKPPPRAAETPPGTPRSVLQRLLSKSPPPPSAPPQAEDSPTPSGAETKTAAALPSALTMLAQRLGLSPFEQDLLLLCVAMELDTRIAGLCARAQDDPQKPYPTFALALALFDQPSWDVLSPERPHRYWRLLEIHQPATQPLTTSPLRADERIVNYIKGLNYLDDRLSPLLIPLDVPTGDAGLPPSQQAAVDFIVDGLKKAPADHRLPIIHLLGADPASKQLVVAHAAAALGLRLYRVPANLLPTAPGDLETLARLWQRESILMPIALYLDAHDTEPSAGTDATTNSVSRFLARSNDLVFLDSRVPWPDLGQPAITREINKPTPVEQREAWATAAKSAPVELPGQLAAQFNLGVDTIRQIAAESQNLATNGSGTLPQQIWRQCLESTRPQMDSLAQQLDPKADWNDIVLPAQEMNLLKQIANQVRQRHTVYDEWGFRRKMNRGFSISALFAGDSGTGKTMAAEVIANDLQLNLYRIDLSAVINKYIGETEKNLRRLFDAAEDGGAILFFDEADALFGKRSEVKDSHDRYANIEINYLLQRIESYRGLAILATNMKNALDTAFLRRLRFIVDFPYPAVADRRRLWERALLQQETADQRATLPLGKLDYDRLARLNLTGGHIHSVALNAAFLAAHAGTSVTMPLILNAARTEFRKLGRPISETDFAWVAPPAVVSTPAGTTPVPVAA